MNAESHFTRLLVNCIQMHRKTLADGTVVVGWTGAAPQSYIPLDRAIAIWRELVSVWTS